MTDMAFFRARTGDLSQILGMRSYRLTGGAAQDTRAVDVKTGGGLEYTVLPDRGMDISRASYKGINLCYHSGCGEAHPAFYSHDGNEWLRIFHGGMLTTCGPTYLGPPCVDEGEKLGLHGRFTAMPASSFSDASDLRGEKKELCLKGEIAFQSVFGERIRVYRKIISPAFENRILLEDVFVNEGSMPVPLAVLYHINFGYPFLDDHIRIRVDSLSVEACDEYSRTHMEGIGSFLPPDPENMEKNYLHRFGNCAYAACASVENPSLGLGARIAFSPEELPFLNQWQFENIRDYVLALEPANVPCESRSTLRAQGVLPMLMPGEEKAHHIELSFYDL